jgi:hypothetical protein
MAQKLLMGGTFSLTFLADIGFSYVKDWHHLGNPATE